LRQLKEGQNYFKEEEISNVIRVPFADTHAYIPKNWHPYLKRKFGPDYLDSPLHEDAGYHGDDVPDPFTPCDHKHAMVWKKGATS
jgi:hypothetical protein